MTSLPLRLLADIQTIWPRDEDAVLTNTVICSLQAMSESPWSKETELSPHKLARLLRGFEVRPRTVRVHEAYGKVATLLGELKVAWTRYLPSKAFLGDLDE